MSFNKETKITIMLIIIIINLVVAHVLWNTSINCLKLVLHCSITVFIIKKN